MSIRKKSAPGSTTGKPIPLPSADDLPLRRVQRCERLELSIYLPGNRLSDWPEFEDIDFNATGEIQLPPQALVHSRSEARLPAPQTVDLPIRPSSSSIAGGHKMVDLWGRRSPSFISTTRPPNEYDALHSHPVMWHTLPEFPRPVRHRHPEPVTTLSPMMEESSRSTASKDDHPTEFPALQAENTREIGGKLQPEIRPPFRLQRPSGHHRQSSYTATKQRVSQWLARSTSTDTMRTSLTASSNMSHQTKGSHFYRCATSPPRVPHPHLIHERRSSASTVASSTESAVESVNSLVTMTTAPTTVLGHRTRSETSKSCRSPPGDPKADLCEQLPTPPQYAAVKGQLQNAVDRKMGPTVGVCILE